MSEVFTCGGCEETWTGLGRAHCSACHRTFSKATLFDRHRRTGKCLKPEFIKHPVTGARLMFKRNGVWSWPEMPEEQKMKLRESREEPS